MASAQGLHQQTAPIAVGIAHGHHAQFGIAKGGHLRARPRLTAALRSVRAERRCPGWRFHRPPAARYRSRDRGPRIAMRGSPRPESAQPAPQPAATNPTTPAKGRCLRNTRPNTIVAQSTGQGSKGSKITLRPVHGQTRSFDTPEAPSRFFQIRRGERASHAGGRAPLHRDDEVGANPHWPNLSSKRRHVNLIGLIIPGQHMHDQIDTKAIGQFALPLAGKSRARPGTWAVPVHPPPRPRPSHCRRSQPGSHCHSRLRNGMPSTCSASAGAASTQTSRLRWRPGKSCNR